MVWVGAKKRNMVEMVQIMETSRIGLLELEELLQLLKDTSNPMLHARPSWFNLV